MSDKLLLIKDNVHNDWIDYNGHMNDAKYVQAFSWGVDRFMKAVGIDDTFRIEKQYTLFTMENHVCYLAEMKKDEPFEIYLQLLDYDKKRAHIFFELYGEDGKRSATSEQMLMGIDQKIRKPAEFPEQVLQEVQDLAEKYSPVKKPVEAGRLIGIRRKG